jgi:hypothetical protein
MRLLKRYERFVQEAVEADRAAGGSGFFTIQAHWVMWLLPLTVGSALGDYLMHSVLGRLLFAAPFIIVFVAGSIVATRAGLRAKR